MLQQETEDTMLYLINRVSDVYINDQLPSLCMDELAYETGKVFYPMVVEIDKKAHRVALRNYQQIKSNWINVVRPHVELRFGGEIGEKYLALMDAVMNSKDKIEETFKNDLFLKFYFGTFYQSYSPQLETDRILDFFIGEDSPSFFSVKCTLNKNMTDKGYQEIIQSGTGLKRLSPENEDFIEDEHLCYFAQILLETETNNLREAVAEWNFKNKRQKSKLIVYPAREQLNHTCNFKIDKLNNKGCLFSWLFG